MLLRSMWYIIYYIQPHNGNVARATNITYKKVRYIIIIYRALVSSIRCCHNAIYSRKKGVICYKGIRLRGSNTVFLKQLLVGHIKMSLMLSI